MNGQLVIAINPDPARWDGQLLPFRVTDADQAIVDTVAARAPTKSMTFAEATTNDGQRMLAVNDLFNGPRSHSSARYLLNWNGEEETQSSSGIR